MKNQLIIPNIIDLDEIYWMVECRFGRNIFFFLKNSTVNIDYPRVAIV